MKKLLKDKLVRIALLVLLILIIILVFALVFTHNKATIDTTFIISKLENSSELTTSKLTYEGFSRYTDEGIDYVTKQDFFMQYSAEVRAGIDVKNVDINVNKLFSTITLTIPKAEILEVRIIPESLQFYNEGFALFNMDPREDTTKAISLAEEDAKTKIGNMGLLDMADSQAELLIKGLVQDIIPEDYKLVVKRAK